VIVRLGIFSQRGESCLDLLVIFAEHAQLSRMVRQAPILPPNTSRLTNFLSFGTRGERRAELSRCDRA